MELAPSFSTLDSAETPWQSSSVHNPRRESNSFDLFSIVALIVTAYALFVKQDLAVFAIAFLAFMFVWSSIH